MGREDFQFHPQVKAALDKGEPVVALESTVITHGLPYPDNVETAAHMETAVRDGGAVPATIAILAGEVHIGLTPDQLEYVGQKAGTAVRKCSRRDLPIIMAQGLDGATTVAGTMILAQLAGIELFATGGIGGVHRGQPFDVSADLAELSRTPVTIVCSGPKSILDLVATREVLETNGVPVIGFGVDEMPSFFTRSSGLPVDARVDTPTGVATMICTRRTLGLQNGILVTVPVPTAHACDPAEMEVAINQASHEAGIQGIHGAAATPWLLRRLIELTNGRSLYANVSLLRKNAMVAGQIAAALSERQQK